MPSPANHPVNFSQEIKPIFEASCIKCHGRGKEKGGFRLDSRETALKGGDSGPAVLPGKSAESPLIALVPGVDPDNFMPRKGSRLTAEQIGLLRAWIDQGAPWDAQVTFGRVEPANLKPRLPAIPAATKAANPIDRFLEPYFASHKIQPPKPVPDRLFARRAYLDVIGLLPPPEELETFVAERREDKRARLVEGLLADDRNYAEHWLSFWNDLLRNDYKGTGYIDGGAQTDHPLALLGPVQQAREEMEVLFTFLAERYERRMRGTCDIQATHKPGEWGMRWNSPLALWWCPSPCPGGSIEPLAVVRSSGRTITQMKSTFPPDSPSDSPPPAEDRLFLPAPGGRALRLIERSLTIVCFWAASVMYCGADTPNGRVPVSTNSNVN